MALEKQLVSAAILVLLISLCQSQYTMIAPSQPIIASVGSDVTLSCELDPVKDLRDLVVEWARQDLTPRYVHIRRDGLTSLLDKNSLYLGRTALSESRLQKGDMSLSLTRVKPSDGGAYQCFIPQVNTRAEVTLLVVSVAPVSVSLTQERGSPVLRCESRGWYPEPELEWLDSEGTVLLRTEAQRGASDELFSVSSRLSVEQRLGNTLTCRVKQQESGQSREAQLILTDEFLEACSSCAVAWVLFGLGLCLAAAAAAAAAAFVVWKFKLNRNKSEIRNIEVGRMEERESMMNDEKTNVLKSEEVTQRFYLKEFVPEQKENLEHDLLYVNDVIHKLTQTKDFLMKLKDQPQEAIHNTKCLIEAEERRQINDMKIFTTKKKEEAKKQHLEALKREKKPYEETIEALDNQMKTLEEVILVTVQRKGALEGELNHMTKLMEKEKKRLETESEQVRKEEEEKVNVQERAQDQPEGAQSGNREQGTVNTLEPTEVEMEHLCDHFGKTLNLSSGLAKGDSGQY